MPQVRRRVDQRVPLKATALIPAEDPVCLRRETNKSINFFAHGDTSFRAQFEGVRLNFDVSVSASVQSAPHRTARAASCPRTLSAQ
jgi:hypothetical protein